MAGEIIDVNTSLRAARSGQAAAAQLGQAITAILSERRRMQLDRERFEFQKRQYDDLMALKQERLDMEREQLELQRESDVLDVLKKRADLVIAGQSIEKGKLDLTKSQQSVEKNRADLATTQETLFDQGMEIERRRFIRSRLNTIRSTDPDVPAHEIIGLIPEEGSFEARLSAIDDRIRAENQKITALSDPILGGPPVPDDDPDGAREYQSAAKNLVRLRAAQDALNQMRAQWNRTAEGPVSSRMRTWVRGILAGYEGAEDEVARGDEAFSRIPFASRGAQGAPELREFMQGGMSRDELLQDGSNSSRFAEAMAGAIAQNRELDVIATIADVQQNATPQAKESLRKEFSRLAQVPGFEVLGTFGFVAAENPPGEFQMRDMRSELRDAFGEVVIRPPPKKDDKADDVVDDLSPGGAATKDTSSQR